MDDGRRGTAAEAAAAMVVAAFQGDYDGAVDALAASGVDARLVAVELAAMTAKAMQEAYGDQTWAAAIRPLTGVHRANVKTAITWHRGHGGGYSSEPGEWHATVGNWTIAIAWCNDSIRIGDPDRYGGEIYGKPAQATTLREFKALVAKAHAERQQA
jgi:hypothetical protein